MELIPRYWCGWIWLYRLLKLMVSLSFMLEGFREFSEIVFCVCVSVGGGEVYVYMCDLYITPPCTITLYFFLSN